jgi:hypothetical protein
MFYMSKTFRIRRSRPTRRLSPDEAAFLLRGTRSLKGSYMEHLVLCSETKPVARYITAREARTFGAVCASRLGGGSGALGSC